jgi:hypothetical protein
MDPNQTINVRAALEDLAYTLSPPSWEQKPSEEWTQEETDAFIAHLNSEVERNPSFLVEMMVDFNKQLQAGREAEADHPPD